MKGVIPDGFEMIVNPIPSLANDKKPFDADHRDGRRRLHRSAQAKNVKGGMEWLRLLFSVSGARFFSENTKSLTVVNGSGDGLDLGTAFASAQARDRGRWPEHLPRSELRHLVQGPRGRSQEDLGGMLQGKMSVSDFQSKVQDMADSVNRIAPCPSTHDRPRASVQFRKTAGIFRRSSLASIGPAYLQNKQFHEEICFARIGGDEGVFMHHHKYRLIVPFMFPALLLYGVFVLYPYAQAIYLSLTSWRGLTKDKPWVGLAQLPRALA